MSPASSVAVELLEEPPDELGPPDVFHLVDDEALAPDDASLAHQEHLDRRLERVVDDADGVVVLFLGVDHLLAFDRLAHGHDLVAQAGRSFELERVAGFVHVLVEPIQDRRGVAVEERDELGDEVHVLVVGDRGDARRHALLDVGVKTGPAQPCVAVELVPGARADRERAEEQVERLPDGVRVGVGAEVADALALRSPHHHGPGPLLVEGDREVGVRLVVLQPDVEPRPVLLDEVELEEQRLDLVADRDPLHGVGRADHLERALGQTRPEVRHDPAAEALGLADVEHPPGRRP